MMTPRQVAEILHQIHIYMELHGEEEFRSKAYSRASRALETSTVDLAMASEQGKLASIPGIGKAMAGEIEQILAGGTTEELERLREITPAGLMEILGIRGLGPKKVRAIHTQLAVETLEALETAAREGRIAPLAGFGAKSQEKILAGVEELKRNRSRLRLNHATVESERILGMIRSAQGILHADITGDLRRGAEHIESLDFLVATRDASALEATLAADPSLSAVNHEPDAISAIALDAIPVSITICPADLYVAALHRTSATEPYLDRMSERLAEKGYRFESDRLMREGEPIELGGEQEIFQHAGLVFIPPELREGYDEVERATTGTLPELITIDDMLGVMHVHSTWSDGRNGLDELAEFAHGRGWRYLLICDHSKAAFYANGLDEDRLERQGREIDGINERYDPALFRMLKGVECDILADGTMDLSDDSLDSLDAVVASIHSAFHLPIEEQTDRICRALEHPSVTILGHATGRLILSRKGYEIDYQRVISHAKQHGRSIELNANPYRLDMNWRMVRHAISQGVPIAINPDAHSLADYENLRYGITMGRKAGMQKSDLLNARDADSFLAFARGT